MLSLEKQILYIIKNRHEVSTSEFIHIYKDCGKSDQVVRNTLSALKKKGYIKTENGKHLLTDVGVSTIQGFQLKFDSKLTEWDGHWHFVMFSIPEQYRSLRNAFRRDLTQIGYGPLYDGVFVCPYSRKSSVLDAITQYGLDEWVRIVNGEFDYGLITNSQVDQIWHIDEINNKYYKFIELVNSKISEFSSNNKDQTNATPWNTLLKILELGEIFGEILLEDPFLPKEFLPDNWMMQTARNLYHQHVDQLAQLLKSDYKLLSLVVPVDLDAASY
ncbi:PaaX family transcriptional regulator C-terminal domain-containing protein [Desulfosporosinus sp. PR]|uniref:PaaX family transcriptional regulator C-terminal domain-containing protein n=1 Tax=Candidatus Desulfosporosinus nitrosoreducens TaxID=3401928 RepID=UPI0027F2E783|nr:PaaX family transcriptional regulator C-terminal domain-containing protein [Desulfosporosinus sp. PR]MDQ7094393.1 PaaX family transcriptional regulator C-terminal domain-containing protein [Desulfosporosinus sp. PR]